MIPKIQLPNPCSQNPRNFTPTGKGGFCQSCQKEVVDFRAWSKEEVIDFLQISPSTQCGIFLPIHFQPEQIPLRKVKLPGVWALGFLGLLGLGIPAKTQAQTKEPYEKSVVGQESRSSNVTKVVPKHSVRGKLLGKDDGVEIPGAMILLKGFKIGTTTDVDGNFELEIPENISENKITLVFSFIGYSPLERTLYLTQLPAQLGEVFLEPDHSAVLGEFIYIPHKKNIWQKFKGVFQKSEKPTCSNPSHSHS